MFRILKTELKKAFRNKLFLVTLAVGLVIGFVSAYQNISSYARAAAVYLPFRRILPNAKIALIRRFAAPLSQPDVIRRQSFHIQIIDKPVQVAVQDDVIASGPYRIQKSLSDIGGGPLAQRGNGGVL